MKKPLILFILMQLLVKKQTNKKTEYLMVCSGPLKCSVCLCLCFSYKQGLR